MYQRCDIGRVHGGAAGSVYTVGVYTGVYSGVYTGLPMIKLVFRPLLASFLQAPH